MVNLPVITVASGVGYTVSTIDIALAGRANDPTVWRCAPPSPLASGVLIKLPFIHCELYSYLLDRDKRLPIVVSEVIEVRPLWCRGREREFYRGKFSESNFSIEGLPTLWIYSSIAPSNHSNASCSLPLHGKDNAEESENYGPTDPARLVGSFSFQKMVSNHFWQIGLSSAPYSGLLNKLRKGMCKSTAKHSQRSSAKLFKIFNLSASPSARGFCISDRLEGNCL